MQSRNSTTKNLYEMRGTPEFTPDTKPAVFISYKRDPDRNTALKCAEIFRNTQGLYYWLDEEQTLDRNGEFDIALCIEEGLDESSALLGIIGDQTFNSSWVPYEIGGARGRQRFNKYFKETPSPDKPHPLIAHLILDTSVESDSPDFVKLGTPLRCLCEVFDWAQYIAKILNQPTLISLNETQKIREDTGIHAIYKKNVEFFTKQ